MEENLYLKKVNVFGWSLLICLAAALLKVAKMAEADKITEIMTRPNSSVVRF